MITELRRMLREIIQPINTAAISIMGVYTILWGLWVASPFWEVFNRADAFKYLDKIAPEWAWGLIAIAVGAAILNGVFRKVYHSLTVGALSGFLFWVGVAFFFLIGDWQNTGGITYLMIAVYCGFIWLNLRINRNHFDKNVS